MFLLKNITETVCMQEIIVKARNIYDLTQTRK